MKIYFDVSCLNRPFDDQRQVRIRLEAEALTWILERCEQSDWHHVSSAMARIEIDAIPDPERRARVELLLPEAQKMLKLSNAVLALGAELERLGFKPADAVHLAAAEALRADVLISCDDRFVRLAHRRKSNLVVRVANPLEWLEGMGNDPDS